MNHSDKSIAMKWERSENLYVNLWNFPKLLIHEIWNAVNTVVNSTRSLFILWERAYDEEARMITNVIYKK